METRSKAGLRSVPELLRDLRDESTALLQKEIALAKIETGEKVSRTARNVGYAGAAALVILAGFLFLLYAATAGLGVGLAKLNPALAEHSLWLAPLITGLIVILFGYLLLRKALNTLKSESLMPEKTVQTLKEDKEWLQRKVA